MKGRQCLNVGVSADLDLVLEEFERLFGPSRLLFDGILLHLDQIAERPLVAGASEDEGTAIMTAGDGGVLVGEDDVRQRQESESHRLNVAGSTARQIHKRHRRIMRNEGEAISTRRPADRMNPTSDEIFGQHVTEILLVAEWSCGRFVINSFDVGGEDAGLEVAGAGQQQLIIRMPINAQHG